MLKLGVVTPDGWLVTAQLYVRFDSPPSSAPSTLRLVVVPVTVPGEAAAGVATVGAWLPEPPLTVNWVSQVPHEPPLRAYSLAAQKVEAAEGSMAIPA